MRFKYCVLQRWHIELCDSQVCEFCLPANPLLAPGSLAAKHFLGCSVITGSCPVSSPEKGDSMADDPLFLLDLLLTVIES